MPVSADGTAPPATPPPSKPRPWRPVTARERRLWMLAAGYLLALYASAYTVGVAMRALIARGLLGVSIVGLFAACGLAVGIWLLRQHPGPREVAVLLLGAALYPLLASRMHILQERLHLVQYGLLGALYLAALEERRRALGDAPGWFSRSPALTALLLSTLGGWGDELVQGLVPKRYYDLRDVAFNAGAAALLIGLASARKWARRRDHAAAPRRAATG